ncbi:MAG: Smr/MutS family protein [Gammaproteobacteria bacterium]
MKNQPDDKDRALFRKAAGAVRPVRDDRHQYARKKPSPHPKFREADEVQVLQDMLSDVYEPLEIDTGDELIYLRAGMQKRTLKKLRRGQINIGAELDLHGMTVPVARAAISEFLYECKRRHLQCIRIIHGKGLGSRQREPVLKGKVGGWLRQRDDVLAYSSARHFDGGSGALYVLLKRE